MADEKVMIAWIDWAAAILFGCAIMHTFSVKLFQNLARRYPEGSVQENLFHLLGEIEMVFGIWAMALLGAIALSSGTAVAVQYLESLRFSEPIFVFVVLVICGTKPILDIAEKCMMVLAKMIPMPRSIAFFWVILTVGPLMGSFITEPAAMTVSALLLLRYYFQKPVSEKFKYTALGALFVNVSIGGVMTPYAAPPVLMVASKWGLGIHEMFFTFGWKGALACVLSTSWVTYSLRHELKRLNIAMGPAEIQSPCWMSGLHLVILTALVTVAHHSVLVFGLFLLFLGVVKVTAEYQSRLKIRDGLMVAFFLAGLVVLGGMQSWWITPLIQQLTELPLFLGATSLTAVTDNAALTYLGSLVPDLSESARYALLAGAVTGGGLTVIANAPNPAGYSILLSSFGDKGISPIKLFISASAPTLLAAICFWFLR